MAEYPLSCSVLGAVRVEADARAVKIAAPRQRALLALLLLNGNRTVSSSSLIDGIWGEAPPQHPDSALHIVVCRLRHAAGRGRVEARARPRGIPDRARGGRARPHPRRGACGRGAPRARCRRRSDGVTRVRRRARVLDRRTARRCRELSFYDTAARRLRELQLGLIESRNIAYRAADDTSTCCPISSSGSPQTRGGNGCARIRWSRCTAAVARSRRWRPSTICAGFWSPTSVSTRAKTCSSSRFAFSAAIRPPRRAEPAARTHDFLNPSSPKLGTKAKRKSGLGR